MWGWLLAAHMVITDIILMHAPRTDTTGLIGSQAVYSSVQDRGITATGVVDGAEVGATDAAGDGVDAAGAMAVADTTVDAALPAGVGMPVDAGIRVAQSAAVSADRQAAGFTVEAAATAAADTGNRS
jgi:hypothetical protein